MRFSELPDQTPREERLDRARAASVTALLDGVAPTKLATAYAWRVARGEARKRPKLEGELKALGAQLTLRDDAAYVHLPLTRAVFRWVDLAPYAYAALAAAFVCVVGAAAVAGVVG